MARSIGLLARAYAGLAGQVMLPSPNNPTGTLLPNADIEVLCREDCL